MWEPGRLIMLLLQLSVPEHPSRIIIAMGHAVSCPRSSIIRCKWHE